MQAGAIALRPFSVSFYAAFRTNARAGIANITPLSATANITEQVIFSVYCGNFIILVQYN